MATRVNHGRPTKVIYLLHPQNPLLDARIPKISLTQIELLPILSQISLPWQRGSVREKFDWQHSLAHPRKPPYERKNLADISYTKRVIANFVPNFVAMATGVGEKCNWQHSMAHPRKPPYRRKNLAKISYTIRVIANFVPNFVAMATTEGPG